jgi:hypothetical protein
MKTLAAIAVLLIVTCGTSDASIIFTLGNNPQPNEDNILLNSGATGTLVTGTINSNPGIIVDFSSSQNLAEPSSGQARVSASPEGTPLTNLSISVENGRTYGDLIINPFIGNPCSNCTGGQAAINVFALAANGTPEAPATFTGLTIGNGNNFLTITTSGGEQIVSTSINVPGGINDLRQPRISGPLGTALVPEPATYVLIASGLGALGLMRRFRKF